MDVSFFDSAAIRYDYDRLWHASRDKLIQGLIQPDPLPDTPDSYWGISAVFRPTGEIVAKLDEITLRLAECAGTDQVLYTHNP